MGAQTGSATIAGLFVVTAVPVFTATVGREEAWLPEAFGPTYAAYVARTPRFWPDVPEVARSGCHRGPAAILPDEASGRPRHAPAFPLFETVEHFRDIGWLWGLLNLPREAG